MSEMMKTKAIHKITDLHVWSLSGGKNIMTAHVFIKKCSELRYRGLTHKV